MDEDLFIYLFFQMLDTGGIDLPGFMVLSNLWK